MCVIHSFYIMNCFLYVYVSLNLVAAQSHCLNIDEHGDIALFKFTLEYNYELFLNRFGSDSLQKNPFNHFKKLLIFL